jgi:hypothetical protein
MYLIVDNGPQNVPCKMHGFRSIILLKDSHACPARCSSDIQMQWPRTVLFIVFFNRYQIGQWIFSLQIGGFFSWDVTETCALVSPCLSIWSQTHFNFLKSLATKMDVFHEGVHLFLHECSMYHVARYFYESKNMF